ncbi:FATTY ACID EXPORT 1, chloroplastic [Olea europaea subsp. europaea]|uniref:FATTY ACID EXPORT 1, chloroplastic n=1 Tax=Olea europaea subsp. europaea TaxID=158383 RepID=A0A8S0TY49_OLEEU|nr:FATTY ACID EXPORT 1, chloroplastic [Olea europaea subsp. europaea]
MSSAISQLSCFSSINRSVRIRTRSYARSNKVFIVRSIDGHSTDVSNSETKTAPHYTAYDSKSLNGCMEKSHPITQEHVAGEAMNEHTKEQVVSQPKRAAKIHDFCLGIPFGGLVLGGGLVGFIFSRNLATLSTAVLFGASLLVLSTVSMKVWRQGKSSLPFILGQAVLSASLLWKNFQTYTLVIHDMSRLYHSNFYLVYSIIN